MTQAFKRFWPAAAIWAVAWAVLLWLDGSVDLANLAMVLVLASAVASLWLPMGGAVGLSLVAVLAFNWVLVPPRGSFGIDMEHHALLLATMLAMSWITAGLMARLRRQAEAARRHAQEAEQMRAFGEALRDAVEPRAQGEALRAALQHLASEDVRVLLLNDALPPTDDAAAALVIGPALDADQWTGLWQCLRRSIAFGPGTQRHEELPAWYLPLRGRQLSLGAALIELGDHHADPALRAQAQSLCDQLGVALERNAAARTAQRAVDAAEAQGVRNALLAAISHDYRTPLATILSAASALQQQDEKLTPAQRIKLAATIEGETRGLSRMTDNTLQIARLDAPGVVLRMDWESAEEIVGAALRRARTRDASARVKARVEPDLPLLRCDAVLMAQLLDNLIDNALKYGGDEAVELRVKREGEWLNLAVRDRGPGVTPAWRERIFEVFQRGASTADAAQPRGAGIGLAACRAIAQAHGGTMRLRARSHGGASFECLLPLTKVPE